MKKTFTTMKKNNLNLFALFKSNFLSQMHKVYLLSLLSILPSLLTAQNFNNAEWLQGSWGARLYVRGGNNLDTWVDQHGYDYIAGAQEIVDTYTTSGHVLTNMTQNARTNKFTLRYNPNVAAKLGNDVDVIHEDFVPSKDNEQIIIDVIRIFKDANKKVMLYLNCKEFAEVETTKEGAAAWKNYYTQHFAGDSIAARTDILSGYFKRFKEMGVDGYWLDACWPRNPRNISMIAALREIHPTAALAMNTLKDEFEEYTVDSDGCDDSDDKNYGVIKYHGTVVETDLTAGHVWPLGQGGRGDSWSHEEFTIPDIQESNYNTLEGKDILKHMFLPFRQQWSVASSELMLDKHEAYRYVQKITAAGGAITFSGTSTDGTLKDDEHAILTYVNQQMAANNINYDPYVRPNCAFLVNEEDKTAQTISFSALPNKEVGDSDFNPGASASSGLTVTYISADRNIAKIVNNKIQIVGPGTVRITARQNGNNNYRHAPFKHQMLTVSGDGTVTPPIIVTPPTTGNSDNLALYGSAGQSSTSYGGEPSRAIDGNTNGTWNNGSVTHTTPGTAGEWWQVRLAETANIGEIKIFNRTDNCCSSRLSNFTVKISDGNGSWVFSETYTSVPSPSLTIDAEGVLGRTIRIITNNTDALSLAEVEVYSDIQCASFSTIQTEGYNSMSGILVESTSDSSGNDHLGFINNGDWSKYSSVDLTCATSIQARVSSKNAGGTIEVRLGSASGQLIGSVIVPSTSSWSSWTTVSATIDGVSGTNDVYLVYTGGSGYLFNLNWIQFSNSQAKSITSINNDQGQLLIYPNPVEDQFTLNLDTTETSKYVISDTTGKTILTGQVNDGDDTVNVSGLSSGLYLIQVSNGSKTLTGKIVKQ